MTDEVTNPEANAEGSEAVTDTVLTAETGETEGASEGQPKGEPAEYAEFTVPEGFQADEAAMTDFKAWAKEAGFSQDQAQAALDKYAGTIKAHVDKGASAYVERIEGWKAAVQTDDELGGDHMPERVAVAKKALEAYASPELKKLLNSPDKDNPDGLGLGNHPEVIRMFYRIGKTISDDELAAPASNAAPSKSLAERIYGGKTS